MRPIIVTSGLVFAFAHGLLAQDWAQWRGPSRNGVVPQAAAPAQWPASFDRAWQVQVGEGYSSPVLAGGRVFVHSRQDPKEIVTAVDAASGKVIWRQEYTAAYEKNQYARAMAKGPNATPLVTGGRVFTLGTTGLLAAWDEATGKQIWQNDYSKTVDFSKLFCGTAASPLLAHGLVVVQTGSDIHGGQIAGLDPASGAAKWQWKGPGPGYASPVLIDVSGSSQIVTLTNQSIVGVDARTGAEVWTTPFTDEWHENIVTPIWTGTHLIVSGTRQGTQAYTLVQKDHRWVATQAWKNTAASMYLSSPVVADGLVYGLSDKRRGHFVALDLETGEPAWQTEGREGTTASVLLAPQHIVYLTDAARLVIVRRTRAKFDRAQSYELGLGATWTTPVLLGNDLIVKDATSLVRLTGK
jgi:outer membrane protein assembly factor BamB